MRIAIVSLIGGVIALLVAFGTVRLVTASANEPVIKPLYNYGTR